MRWIFGVMVICLALGPALAQNEGYMLQVAGRLVFVDQGEQDNVRPGDLLQVIRQEVIRHPETGENLAGEVALGAIRIVEVFPRLSTAEVVDLVKGMDLALLDSEARQGLIRVRMLPPEAEMIILERVHARETGMIAPADQLNPDGVLRQFVTEFRLGAGSRPDVLWPAFTYQLVDRLATIGSLLPSANLARPDTAFTNIEDRVLLTLADTTGTPQELIPFGGGLVTQVGVSYPFSERFTFLADFSLGSHSQLSLGARFYPWHLIKFLGDGYTPDGQVGSPVVTLKIGKAGKGPSSLSTAALLPLVARNNLAADSLYAVVVLDTVLTTEFRNLNPSLIQRVDSLFQADTAQMLKTAANQGVKDRTKSGFGISMDVTWPIARHFTLRGHWTQMGNVKEYGGGLTYYLRTVEKADPRVNSDGRIHSPVFTLGARYDTEVKQRLLDFDVVFPLGQRYTLSGSLSTDIKGFTRAGLAFKSYLKGF
jgi:hypothetical protein